MIEYQIRMHIGPNTAIVPTTRGGAYEVLSKSTIRRAERARGCRRYWTTDGIFVAVWAPATEQHKALRKVNGVFTRVWNGGRS